MRTLGQLPTIFATLGLVTPQGSDALLTTPFRKMVETYGHFQTDRMFEVDPENYAAMRLFGVRYVITTERGKMLSRAERQPALPAVGIDADALQSVRVSGCAATLQLGRR